MIQADERWSRRSVKTFAGVKEEIPKKITWKTESDGSGNAAEG